MRVLALDTTTRGGSLALVVDDRVVEERSGDESRTHAECLPAALLDVLGRAGLSPAAIDVFAVAVGPGSFTGIRIGIATIQGLALATGRPVVTASALEMLALAGSAGRLPGTLVGACMNAHRGDLFSALYRVGDQPRFHRQHLLELDPPRVDRADVVLAAWSARFGMPAVLAGDAATLCAAQTAPTVDVRHATAPLAGLLGRWAVGRAAEGAAIHPAAIQPIYVRRPDAELARDRALDSSGAAGGRSA